MDQQHQEDKLKFQEKKINDQSKKIADQQKLIDELIRIKVQKNEDI